MDETLENLVSQITGNSTNPEVSEATDSVYGDLAARSTWILKNQFSLDLD